MFSGEQGRWGEELSEGVVSDGPMRTSPGTFEKEELSFPWGCWMVGLSLGLLEESRSGS